MMRSAPIQGILVACLYGALVSCGGGDKAAGPTAKQEPAQVVIVSGDAQHGVVGAELAQPLVVKVLGANGQPVAGQVVNFVVTSGGGHVFAGSGASNASGVVQERWTLGTSTTAEQKLEARAVDNSTGAPIVFGTFTAVAEAGPAKSVAVVAGDAQSAPVGTAAADSLVAKVTDQYGNPVAGATVAWAATTGGGSVSPGTSSTDAAGMARTRLTVGTVPGINSVSATVTGIPAATFGIMSVAGRASSLALVSGDAQTGRVGEPLAAALVVRALDSYGNPASGASVSWAVTEGGGSIAPASAVTTSDGVSSATWTLGSTLGTGRATATIAGVGTVAFTARATAGGATTLVKVSGDAQTAIVTTRLQPLVVQVSDSSGAPVSGVTVNWSVDSSYAMFGSYPGAATATTVTDASGRSQVDANLPAVPRTSLVTATIANVLSATFAETGTPGPWCSTHVYVDGAAKTMSGGATVRVVSTRTDWGGNLTSTGQYANIWLSGGGSLSMHDSIPGVQVGTWTLGPTGGTQMLMRQGYYCGGSSIDLGFPRPSNIIDTTRVDVVSSAVTSVVLVSGDGQTGPAGTKAANPFVVRVLDAAGNGVPDVHVYWGFNSLPTTTDAQGYASTYWYYPTTPGTATTTAAVGSLPPVTFTLTGT